MGPPLKHHISSLYHKKTKYDTISEWAEWVTWNRTRIIRASKCDLGSKLLFVFALSISHSTCVAESVDKHLKSLLI